MLAAELEDQILNIIYVGLCKGFIIAIYVQQHKTTYQLMLALTTKMIMLCTI